MPFNLINEANFFVVFIALIVVFFLLGLLLGSRIDSKKKRAKDKTPVIPENRADVNSQTDALDQNSQEYMDQQNQQLIQQPRYYRNRYYNNYR